MVEPIDTKKNEGTVGVVTFKDYYIQPLLDHPVTQKIYQLGLEIFKISLALSVLKFTSATFLKETSSVPARQIYLASVVAPVLEEVLFRGLLLRGIHVVQYLVQGNDLTDEELENQKNFRVHLSALIFGAMHLTNPHEDIGGALIQFSWSWFGGVVYGHLSEKYQTLSVSILVHGLNNSLAMAGVLATSVGAKGTFLLAVLVSKFAIYVLCIRTKAADSLAKRVQDAAEYCGTIPRKMIDWCVPKTKAPAAAAG